jgi:two-component system sensor histidine kinase KdpD
MAFMIRTLPGLRKSPIWVSTLLIGCVTLVCLALHDLVGYRVAAFVLLVTVSLLALLFDIRTVISAAVVSALIWDFFFIPPRFTFTVGSTEDQLLLLTYFLVAVVHAVLTRRVRMVEEQARQKEVRVSQIKFYNTLLNSLSHELRTPITTILGVTDTLSSENGGLSEKDRKVLLQELTSACLRLNQQVENLLGMSRLESGVFALKRDWVDVHELVYGTLQLLEPAITKFRVSVFIEEAMPLVKLDVHLMQQVLYNLVNNILQHTPEGTDVIVRTEYEQERFRLLVSDTGPGFPTDEIKHVFEKFYRLQRSRPGGTGLGLSIVKGFVEAHGGTVTLRNLPLSGAEFTIDIPAEATYLNSLKNE